MGEPRHRQLILEMHQDDWKRRPTKNGFKNAGLELSIPVFIRSLIGLYCHICTRFSLLLWVVFDNLSLKKITMMMVMMT